MGSGLFACEQLSALVSDNEIEVLGVVTQPKKEVGRKKELKGTPVFYMAKDFGLDVYEASRSKEIIDQIDLGMADFVVVADYGVILKDYILDAPKIDCINVHGSLLPEYRGASPIQTCLLNGDEKTGVTIMRMVKAMDAGAVYSMVEYEIQKEDVAPVLYEKLAKLGGKELVRVLWQIKNEGLEPVEQNHEAATYCGKISKSDGEINFETDVATKIWDKYRAYYFWPKVFFFVGEKRVIVHDMDLYDGKVDFNGLFALSEDGILVKTKEGVLSLKTLQMEGKKAVSFQEFWAVFEQLLV